ncbi:MAG: DsbA family oxidoreductase [Myxococcota bacterium]
MEPIRVDIWSDVACPWCWVGKRHLEEALTDLPFTVDITWRSFELDPSTPKSVPEGTDLVQRLADKYGTSRAGAQAMIDRMDSVGTDNGLDFRFDKVKPGNTFDAHRLLHFASTKGKQDALKERLFLAYMHEGKLVSDHETLVQLAVEVGLDADQAQAVLSSNDFHAEVRAEQAQAMELGIRGVPFFVVQGRYGLSGAQPAELIRQAIEQAHQEASPLQNVGADADACGPDGCAI